MHLVLTILIRKYLLAFIFAKALQLAKFEKLKKLVINSCYTVYINLMATAHDRINLKIVIWMQRTTDSLIEANDSREGILLAIINIIIAGYIQSTNSIAESEYTA